MYEIIQDLIPNLPQIPYRNGVGEYEGVVAHCTDSDNRTGGDTPSGEINWEKQNWESAFVHFFVGMENDELVIKQSAPTDYKAYGAGTYANQRFVHVEMCMYDDETMFQLAYEGYTWLLAKILYDKDLGVTSAGTLWGHFQVSNILGGTNHQDPKDYLESHGVTWEMFVATVAEKYELMKPPVERKIPMEPWLKEATITAIKDLAKKGRISSPDLWINKVNNDEDISALAVLLINRMV